MTDETTTDASWLGLTGRRVLVAGGGGIGGACARAFADAGASVAVVDLSEAVLEPLDGERAHDDPGGPDRARRGRAGVAETIDRLGGLDVLLHAVGMNDRRPILDFTEDEWDRIITVNLSTLFSLGQAAGRHMVAQRSGRVLALSSVSGPARAPLARARTPPPRAASTSCCA